MKHFKLIFYVIFMFGVSVPAVEAGILITSTQESHGQHRDTSTSKAYIDKNSMRVETNETNKEDIIIYRKDRDVFWVIDNKEKTYTELTRNDIKKMKSQMDDAMKKMEKELENMPPEQRAMIEKMMKGKMPAQPKKTIYKKTASGIKINQWICDKYEGYSGGKKKKEIWTTDWKKLGFSQEHLDVMEGLSEFFSELTGDNTPFFKAGSKQWEKEQGYPGIPVKTISYINGREKYTTEIKEISKQGFAPSLFELPDRLTKKEFPGAR